MPEHLTTVIFTEEAGNMCVLKANPESKYDGPVRDALGFSEAKRNA
jgi:hypothetical protein